MSDEDAEFTQLDDPAFLDERALEGDLYILRNQLRDEDQVTP
jgi:hypothetical protein